jgi:hypothetical protein
VFDPRAQYEERAFYGPCTLLRLDAKTPVILEFKTPKPGAEAFDYVGMTWEDARGFYSLKYFGGHHWESHHKPDNTLALLVTPTSLEVPGQRESVPRGTQHAPNPHPLLRELWEAALASLRMVMSDAPPRSTPWPRLGARGFPGCGTRSPPRRSTGS